MPIFFILFILIPLIEIWGILTVGDWIGGWSTIALIILTALVGSALLKREGLQTLMRARTKLDSGQMPVHEVLEGILLAVAGALLLTPGFFTDFVGIFLLIPLGRALIISELSKRVVTANVTGYKASGNSYNSGSQGSTNGGSSTSDGSTIEGEFSRED